MGPRLVSSSLAAVWSTFSDEVRRRHDNLTPLYAEKFSGDVTRVVDAGPDPLVIDLVRDPCDCICSMRAFNLRQNQHLFGSAQLESAESHLRHVVAEIRFRLTEMQKPLAADRLTVRCEDLILDQSVTCQQISAFSRHIPVDLLQ